MGMKVVYDKSDIETTANMKLLANVLLGVSIFFFTLFFVYWSANNASLDLGSGQEDSFVYQLMIASTSLTVTLLVMQFYYTSTRILRMLKYIVILSNAAILCFAIQQLLRGYDDIFGSDSDRPALEYTYSGLGIGFSGVGTLLCLIHNVYGISETL